MSCETLCYIEVPALSFQMKFLNFHTKNFGTSTKNARDLEKNFLSEGKVGKIRKFLKNRKILKSCKIFKNLKICENAENLS